MSKKRSARGRRGLDLDPLDLANNAHQGWHYLFLRRYDESIDLLQKAIELDTTFPVPGPISDWPRSNAARATAAIAQFDNAVRITGGNRPSMLVLLGHAYAVAGRRAEAEAMLERLRTLSKTNTMCPHTASPRSMRGSAARTKPSESLEKSLR